MFAHGKRDLRPISRHPKYKTEICRTFTTNGTCPYGMRCRFIHPCFNLEPNNYTFSEEHKSAYCSEFSDLKALMKFRRLVRRLPIFEEICPVFSNCTMASYSFLKIRE
ncbi:hypothetical protein O6H91_02G075000 [Diphasiastrum complanatum]|uniref:Uncharacterized protein n=1 Tax=Diphasiastrum complanatum TaxID=34168 RepID=A0ACC2EHH8_DIPCM|nr:hypothetical protein O6H91_02G075000 [Diphasiastrum complanatum]